MSDGIRRLAIAGIAPEIAMFGSCAERNRVLRLPGVLASVSPATPERSIFNSVLATDPDALAAALDELTAAYAESGVRAWTVWVLDEDRESAGLLADRGHELDGAPRLMGLELSRLRRPARPLPAGVELAPAEIAAVGRINELAYGTEGAAWGAALERPPEMPHEALVALVAGRPVSCAVVLDHEGDACVTAVATIPEHQGKGLAGAILAELLDSARRRGLRTGSLQASRAGAPVYERLGFVDVGFVELWELRRA